MDFSIQYLVDTLTAQGIELSLDGSNLELSFTGDAPDEVIIAQVRTHKSALIKYLQNQQGTTSSLPQHTRVQSDLVVSNEQKGIWMTQAKDKSSRAYEIPVQILIGGAVDQSAFQEALVAVATQHEILRSSYCLMDEELVMQITPIDAFTVPYRYQRCAGVYDRQSADSLLEAPAFSLEKGPLFKVQLLAFDDSTLLYFVIHHIIADHVSVNIFKQDLIYYYQAYVQENDVIVPERPSRYAHQPSQVRVVDQKYWEQKFFDSPVPLVLPFQRKRPVRKTYNGATLTYAIPGELALDLRRVAARNHVGFFAILLASVKAVIWHYTQQSDITLGVSVAGRNEETENHIGLFAKVLPLRMEVAGEESFSQLLVRSQDLLLEGIEHQHYSFSHLVAELEGIQDVSRSPLFDIMVDYMVVDHHLMPLGTLSMEAIPLAHPFSKYDLTFTFRDSKAGIDLLLEYNTDLYPDSDINTLLQHYENLLRSICETPHAELRQLALLTQDECNLQLTTGSGELIHHLETSNTVGEFEQAAKRHPYQPAVACGQSVYYYCDLDQLADRLAGYLLQHGAERNIPVAILMDRSEQTVIALLAVLKAGAAFLPIDPSWPAAQIDFIMRDSAAPVIITEAACLTKVPAVFTGEIFAIDLQLDLLPPAKGRLPVSIQHQDLAYILYTSGSTGKPKGVKVSHLNLLNYLSWAKKYYLAGASQVCVGWFTAFSFDLSLTSIFLPLLSGGLLQIYPGQDLKSVFHDIEKHAGFTFLKLTPSHVQYLSFLGVTRFPVSRVILGGESVQEHHVRTLQQLRPGIQIFDEYGPTETTVGCTVERIADSPDSIGLPIANTQVYILNEGQGLMPWGASGEICVGGNGVALGYLGLPELTNARFIDNPFASGKLYRTGDVGQWNKDGKLVFKGRKDDQIKYNGYRIELGYIAACLGQLNGIQRAEVLLKDGNSDEKALVAFLMGSSYDSEALRSHLRQLIPEYMMPSAFHYVDEFPLTGNGKLHTKALLQSTAVRAKQSKSLQHYTPVQLELLNFFEELLAVEGLTIEENLFSAGLNSLKAVKAQSLLERAYPGKIEIHDLFSHASVEKLALLLTPPTVDQLPEDKIIDF